jgi:hypothetical protein
MNTDFISGISRVAPPRSGSVPQPKEAVLMLTAGNYRPVLADRERESALFCFAIWT